MKRFNLFSAILAVVLVVSMCILPAAATVLLAALPADTTTIINLKIRIFY